MSAKPVAAHLGLVALCLLGSGLAPVHAKAPLPTVLLYPASSTDVPALVDLRTRLRLDGILQALTYDPDSASVKRVAAETSHPEWLNGPLSDTARLALARALGVAFYVVVSPGRQSDSTHVELVQTAPPALTFDWYGVNRQYGARALESQAQAALGPASSATGNTAPALVAPDLAPVVAPVPAPVVVAPVPAPVVVAPVPAPVVVAPVPAPVVVAPVPAPVVVAPVPAPVVVAPVPAPVVVAPVPAPVVVAPVPAPVVVAPVPAPVVVAPVPAPVVVAPVPAPVVVAPVPAPVVVAPVPAPVVVAPVPAPVVVAPVPAPVVVAPAPIAPKPLVTAPPSPVADTIKAIPAPEPAPAAKLIPTPTAAPIAAPVIKLPAPIIVLSAPISAPAVTTPAPVPAPDVNAPVFQSHKAAPPAPAKSPHSSVPLVAALPPRGDHFTPAPQEVTTTPPVQPIPARATLPIVKPMPKAEDLAAIAPLMKKGDSALEGGDVVGAIALYRQAVNGAPLSLVPRLKLAQAYQKGGLSEKALSEAQRALEIAPDNQPLQQFLSQLDQENGTSDGTLTRYRVQIDRSPDDPAAHSGLAEALWNSGDLSGAETEYKAAKRLAPTGDHSAAAHLAQLYATQARYDDCLAVLQEAGKDGYALALKIIKNRADTLSSTIEASRDAFTGGKSTREQFYDGAKTTDAQAQALASFVARVTPPPEYKLSHLHRMLSTNLLAQEAATLRAFIETGDTKQSDSVSKLEKAAQTEMLTAQAAEEKMGLWGKK